MRQLDRWVGILFCVTLTGWRRMWRLLGLERPASDPPRRILFIKLVEQGATVLAAGALKHAQDLVGRENVFLCVFKRNAEIVDALRLVDPENQFHIRSDNPWHLARDIAATVWRARRLKIDAIIDMEFFARGSAILAYLCGGTRRVGLHGFLNDTPQRGDLMTHRVSYNPYIHTAHAYRLLVETLYHPPDEIPLMKIPAVQQEPVIPRFAPTAEENERVRAMLGETPGGNSGRPVILLNPNPRDVLGVRKWPLELYGELAGRLLADYPEARLIFTGMADEETLLGALCRELDSPRVLNLAGKTTIAELLTLYTKSDVLVTNDSGSAHFASTTDIHQIVFFGPETPALFGPLGPRTRVVYKHLACSPCLNVYNNRFSFCTDNVCIRSISVDEVYELVQECLLGR